MARSWKRDDRSTDDGSAFRLLRHLFLIYHVWKHRREPHRRSVSEDTRARMGSRLTAKARGSA